MLCRGVSTPASTVDSDPLLFNVPRHNWVLYGWGRDSARGLEREGIAFVEVSPFAKGGPTSFPKSLIGPLDVMPYPPARTRGSGSRGVPRRGPADNR